jgi:phage antirepressor YoqD-like protein
VHEHRIKYMLTLFEYSSNNIRFETRDNRIWINLTDMAKASGKRIDHWKTNASTTEFLTALENSLGSRVVHSVEGNTPSSGTWAIKQVAIKFAAWCSVDFEIWMVNQIDTLMTEGSVSLQPQPQELSRLEILELAIASEKENLVLRAKIEADKPKVEFAEAVEASDTSLEFNEIAKILGWGRTRLMKRLRELEILMLNSTLPYQRFIDAGYFEVSQTWSNNGTLYPFALVTGKGQRWLFQKLNVPVKMTENHFDLY